MDIYGQLTDTLIESIIKIIKESRDDLDSLRSVLKEFCLCTRADALLCDTSKDLLMELSAEPLRGMSKEMSERYVLRDDFIKHNTDIYETLINVESGGYKMLAFPVITALKPLGTLFFCRQMEFSPEEIGAARICAIVTSLKLAKISDEEADKRSIKLRAVRSAMGTLSYTELIAVTRVFEDFRQDGLIVASKIAEKYSITRSVIVSALRKLESAGIIEVRSLGMKGTHIKVLNDLFNGELRKLKG